MRLREAGLLPAGRKGRGGSALITPRQAVLALLTVALDRRDAIEAVELAQEVAGYRVSAVFPGTGGPSFRQDVPRGPRFDNWLTAELGRAAADPAIELPGLQIEPPIGVFTFDSALLAKPPPRLRLVRDTPDLAFEPPDEPPEVRALPPPAVRRVTLVHGDLLCAIGALFKRREPVFSGGLAGLLGDPPEIPVEAAGEPLDASDPVAGTSAPSRAAAASVGHQ